MINLCLVLFMSHNIVNLLTFGVFVVWTIWFDWHGYLNDDSILFLHIRLLPKDSNIVCLRFHWLIFKEMRTTHSGRLGW